MGVWRDFLPWVTPSRGSLLACCKDSQAVPGEAHVLRNGGHRLKAMWVNLESYLPSQVRHSDDYSPSDNIEGSFWRKPVILVSTAQESLTHRNYEIISVWC